MKILKYGNRKSDEVMYDISTPEKLAAAYLLLFKELNEEWHCYTDLSTTEDAELCVACTDGQHKYCTGGDGCCGCDATEDCKKQNRAAVTSRRRTEDQSRWYQKALAGDAKAARWLLTARKSYEYEEVEETYITIIDPLVTK